MFVLKLYLTLRSRALLRLFRGLGIVGAISAVGLMGAIVLGMGNAPGGYWIAMYAAIALTWHLRRNDTTFLRLAFGEQYRWLYLADYVALGLCIATVLIAKTLWLCAVATLPLAVAIALIPRKKVSLKLVTFPCLAQGSYEYQRAGRLFMPFWAVLVAAAIVGLAIDNGNMVVAVFLMSSTGVGMFISLPVREGYLSNFRSFHDFMVVKARQCFINTMVIMWPFVMALFLTEPSLHKLCLAAIAGAACGVYLLQLQLLRFVCRDNAFLQGIIYLLVTAAYCATIIAPWAAVAMVGLTIVMIYGAHSTLKPFFR